ncbi:hypothetical protein D1007_14107 [Hordeum vulgare]|nr:hypothetical protein D1007_14107 [Hordeum vulgare]
MEPAVRVQLAGLGVHRLLHSTMKWKPFVLQQKRKSSSLKEMSPIGLSIDFNNADAAREPLSPLQGA